ncbi:MAG: glycosyltransferase family 2 protein [Fimbriimonadia bacterium]|nr:glycosyltransferase family 2 protein [Fimbriimonadia bacterium]
MKIAAIIPAYNEETRLPKVLQTLLGAQCLHEIVVVNDGSTDRTAEVAAPFEGVRVLNLPRNKGKGGAMFAGATCTDADIIVFFDADLIGFQPEHVRDLIHPVVAEECVMAVGVLKGGRFRTDLAQKITPFISGQRALLRSVFLEVPGIEEARYGVEIALTVYTRRKRYPVSQVSLFGITHTMKEEKLGWWKGTLSRIKMYWEILKAFTRYSRLGQWHQKWILRKQELD